MLLFAPLGFVCPGSLLQGAMTVRVCSRNPSQVRLATFRKPPVHCARLEDSPLPATATAKKPIEKRFNSVRQLFEVGRSKGYVLFDEIYQLLPADLVNDELDELSTRLKDVNLEVIDRPTCYESLAEGKATVSDRTGEGPTPVVELCRVASDRQRPGAHVSARDEYGSVARSRWRSGDRSRDRAW